MVKGSLTSMMEMFGWRFHAHPLLDLSHGKTYSSEGWSWQLSYSIKQELHADPNSNRTARKTAATSFSTMDVTACSRANRWGRSVRQIVDWLLHFMDKATKNQSATFLRF